MEAPPGKNDETRERHMWMAERIEGVYLSQEETSRKNSREEVGGIIQ